MATVNGVGQMRYDWSRRADGTAEATLWIVIFFFPIIPLRREHLRVVSSGLEKQGFLSNALAMIGLAVGSGSGWQSSIQVLERIPLEAWGVVRTYLYGWLVIPLVTFPGPILALVVLFHMTRNRNLPQPAWQPYFGMVFSVANLIWTAILIARILDRSAGRHHIDHEVGAGEQPPCRDRTLNKISNRRP